MKKLAALTMLLMLTGCACGRKDERKVLVLRNTIIETNRRYDYSRDQNERYSRQLHKALKRQGK